MQPTHMLPYTQPEDLQKRREWTEHLFATPGDLPVIYDYAGTKIRGIPAEWNPNVTRRRIDANIV